MLAKANFLKGTSGQIDPASLTRLLVVSFFIALSLGLIQGVEVRLLASPFLPAPYDDYSMRALVLVLSLMTLFNIVRKRAALILALVVFWPSYMVLFAGGDVSAFWRDLALIGGLIMSAQTSRYESDDVQETDHSEVVVKFGKSRPSTRPVSTASVTDPYRKDLNLARSY